MRLCAARKRGFRRFRNPELPERTAIDEWLRRMAAELPSSPKFAELLDEARTAIIFNPALHEVLAAVWQELQREIDADLIRARPQVAVVTERIVRMAGELLKQNPALQDYVNAAFERLVVDYIAPWRDQISSFIAEVVAGWDAKTVSDLIELEVGRELQFVRINGTVIGALIGTVLFLISSVLVLPS